MSWEEKKKGIPSPIERITTDVFFSTKAYVLKHIKNKQQNYKKFVPKDWVEDFNNTYTKTLIKSNETNPKETKSAFTTQIFSYTTQLKGDLSLNDSAFISALMYMEVCICDKEIDATTSLSLLAIIQNPIIQVLQNPVIAVIRAYAKAGLQLINQVIKVGSPQSYFIMNYTLCTYEQISSFFDHALELFNDNNEQKQISFITESTKCLEKAFLENPLVFREVFTKEASTKEKHSIVEPLLARLLSKFSDRTEAWTFIAFCLCFGIPESNDIKKSVDALFKKWGKKDQYSFIPSLILSCGSELSGKSNTKDYLDKWSSNLIKSIKGMFFFSKHANELPLIGAWEYANNSEESYILKKLSKSDNGAFLLTISAIIRGMPHSPNFDQIISQWGNTFISLLMKVIEQTTKGKNGPDEVCLKIITDVSDTLATDNGTSEDGPPGLVFFARALNGAPGLHALFLAVIAHIATIQPFAMLIINALKPCKVWCDLTKGSTAAISEIAAAFKQQVTSAPHQSQIPVFAALLKWIDYLIDNNLKMSGDVVAKHLFETAAFIRDDAFKDGHKLREYAESICRKLSAEPLSLSPEICKTVATVALGESDANTHATRCLISSLQNGALDREIAKKLAVAIVSRFPTNDELIRTVHNTRGQFVQLIIERFSKVLEKRSIDFQYSMAAQIKDFACELTLLLDPSDRSPQMKDSYAKMDRVAFDITEMAYVGALQIDTAALFFIRYFEKKQDRYTPYGPTMMQLFTEMLYAATKMENLEDGAYQVETIAPFVGSLSCSLDGPQHLTSQFYFGVYRGLILRALLALFTACKVLLIMHRKLDVIKEAIFKIVKNNYADCWDVIMQATTQASSTCSAMILEAIASAFENEEFAAGDIQITEDSIYNKWFLIRLEDLAHTNNTIYLERAFAFLFRLNKHEDALTYLLEHADAKTKVLVRRAYLRVFSADLDFEAIHNAFMNNDKAIMPAILPLNREIIQLLKHLDTDSDRAACLVDDLIAPFLQDPFFYGLEISTADKTLLQNFTTVLRNSPNFHNHIRDEIKRNNGTLINRAKYGQALLDVIKVFGERHCTVDTMETYCPGEKCHPGTSLEMSLFQESFMAKIDCDRTDVDYWLFKCRCLDPADASRIRAQLPPFIAAHLSKKRVILVFDLAGAKLLPKKDLQQILVKLKPILLSSIEKIYIINPTRDLAALIKEPLMNDWRTHITVISEPKDIPKYVPNYKETASIFLRPSHFDFACKGRLASGKGKSKLFVFHPDHFVAFTDNDGSHECFDYTQFSTMSETEDLVIFGEQSNPVFTLAMGPYALFMKKALSIKASFAELSRRADAMGDFILPCDRGTLIASILPHAVSFIPSVQIVAINLIHTIIEPRTSYVPPDSRFDSTLTNLVRYLKDFPHTLELLQRLIWIIYEDEIDVRFFVDLIREMLPLITDNAKQLAFFADVIRIQISYTVKNSPDSIAPIVRAVIDCLTGDVEMCIAALASFVCANVGDHVVRYLITTVMHEDKELIGRLLDGDILPTASTRHIVPFLPSSLFMDAQCPSVPNEKTVKLLVIGLERVLDFDDYFDSYFKFVAAVLKSISDDAVIPSVRRESVRELIVEVCDTLDKVDMIELLPSMITVGLLSALVSGLFLRIEEPALELLKTRRYNNQWHTVLLLGCLRSPKGATVGLILQESMHSSVREAASDLIDRVMRENSHTVSEIGAFTFLRGLHSPYHVPLLRVALMTQELTEKEALTIQLPIMAYTNDVDVWRVLSYIPDQALNFFATIMPHPTAISFFTSAGRLGYSLNEVIPARKIREIFGERFNFTPQCAEMLQFVHPEGCFTGVELHGFASGSRDPHAAAAHFIETGEYVQQEAGDTEIEDSVSEQTEYSRVSSAVAPSLPANLPPPPPPPPPPPSPVKQ